MPNYILLKFAAIQTSQHTYLKEKNIFQSFPVILGEGQNLTDVCIFREKWFTSMGSKVACKRQMFLLAHHPWGTFREEERLRLSDRNSILITQNLSGIQSEALIGRQSRFIVIAIVYKWQTKGRKGQM